MHSSLYLSSSSSSSSSSTTTTMKSTPAFCDLCHHQKPSVYCSSDSAFLCSDCDSQVHTANFLVARHTRLSLCSLCKSFHHSSSPSPTSSSSSSSSSSCSSVCTSNTHCGSMIKTVTSRPNRTSSVVSDWKTRDVLENWCTKLGVSCDVVEVARHAFEWWWARRWVWPYRLGLAASLWMGLLRFFANGDEKKRIRMRYLLKRLEEISGVPARSIVAAESKLASMMKHRRHEQEAVDEEEGWAEC